jgi:hypothetical protein
MWFRRRTAQAALLAATTLLTSCSLALDFDKTASEPRTETGFCQKHVGPPAVFCDDFDVDAFGSKWPAVEQTNGTAKDDNMAFLSSPNSLLSLANAVPMGGGVRSVGSIGFPALKSTKVGLRISFSIRVDQFDATSGAKNIVFDFLYGPVNDFNQIVVNLVSTETAVSVQVAENAQKVGSPTSDYAPHGPFTTKPALGQWMKVAIDLDILNPVGLGNNLRVRLDDQVQLDTQLQVALKGDTPRIELGVGWVDSSKPTQAWAVRYDDFLVETIAL